jgi:hypothetical protein
MNFQKTTIVEFLYIQPSNLKSVERRKSNLKKIDFAAQFAAPSALLPGTAASLPPNPTPTLTPTTLLPVYTSP